MAPPITPTGKVHYVQPKIANFLGSWDPDDGAVLCLCGNEAVLRETTNLASPNLGREFWSCAIPYRSEEVPCKTFLWDDQSRGAKGSVAPFFNPVQPHPAPTPVQSTSKSVATTTKRRSNFSDDEEGEDSDDLVIITEPLKKKSKAINAVARERSDSEDDANTASTPLAKNPVTLNAKSLQTPPKSSSVRFDLTAMAKKRRDGDEEGTQKSEWAKIMEDPSSPFHKRMEAVIESRKKDEGGSKRITISLKEKEKEKEKNAAAGGKTRRAGNEAEIGAGGGGRDDVEELKEEVIKLERKYEAKTKETEVLRGKLRMANLSNSDYEQQVKVLKVVVKDLKARLADI